jgi:hypothetical protein
MIFRLAWHVDWHAQILSPLERDILLDGIISMGFVELVPFIGLFQFLA